MAGVEFNYRLEAGLKLIVIEGSTNGGKVHRHPTL
jgi:hypothetical protein